MQGRTFGFRILVTCTLILALCATAQAGKLQQQLVEESTLEQVLQRGVLRVGMSTFVPWAMKDKTGKLVGFEIDVATRLAKDMGVKVEFVPTQWSGIIPALVTGKFDVIIGGMGTNPGPVIGAAVGAGVNAAFQNDVAAAARFAYRARWLEVNEGIIEGHIVDAREDRA